MLRRLRISLCIVRLNEASIPHIRNLTSFEWLYFEFRQDHTITNQMWNTFLQEDIHVAELWTNRVNEALFQYLQSYHGLKKLRLTGLYDPYGG